MNKEVCYHVIWSHSNNLDDKSDVSKNYLVLLLKKMTSCVERSACIQISLKHESYTIYIKTIRYWNIFVRLIIRYYSISTFLTFHNFIHHCVANFHSFDILSLPLIFLSLSFFAIGELFILYFYVLLYHLRVFLENKCITANMIRNLWSKVTISIFFYLLHVQQSQSHDMRLDVIFNIIIGQLIAQRLIFIQIISINLGV